MNVVDSSAWLSYFAEDTNSGLFAKPIEVLDRLLVPTITVTEVFKSVFRQPGEASALAAVAHMRQGESDCAGCGIGPACGVAGY